MIKGLENAKILICDDSQILNDLLRDVFEGYGFEVVQACDGYRCKTAFLKETPDISFLDIRMPEADGIEVLRFIKKKSPDALVVMMTGAGSEETAVEAMKLGANDYLNKPFPPGEMVELAARLLERRKSDKETSRLRKEIRRGERYLAHLANIINEALITTNRKGRIEFVNRAAAQMWGYTPEELRGKDLHFLIRGRADALLHRDIVRDTIKLGKLEGEYFFRKKDKTGFPGYLSTSVIREGDRLRGIVMVVADLTRLREIESRLRQSEKLASLGKVVEGVAHEVRNCLTSLGGFAMRLRKRTLGDPDCDTFTRYILDDVERLESMVHQIEDYVRFSKFHRFRFQDVDLAEVIDRAHHRVRAVLDAKTLNSVGFRINADREIPLVKADPDAMEEVFYNLILNAYEALPSGGKCTVTLTKEKTGVLVSVTDTGVGIPGEEIGEIFNPFVTSKTTGAGMGLSKVFMLVEEHRGSVKVRSEPNKGTTFDVTIPQERAPASELHVETPTVQARNGRRARRT
jgi:PAS domain S-box-containing protein